MSFLQKNCRCSFVCVLVPFTLFIFSALSSHCDAQSNNSHNETAPVSVSFSGWRPSTARLQQPGINPAAVLMGRYALIIGGSVQFSSNTPFETFLMFYSLTKIGALDLYSGYMVFPMMLLPKNTSNCTFAGVLRNDHRHDNVGGNLNCDEEAVDSSHSSNRPPLPPRAPAELPLPAFGTANTVVLGFAAYVIAFCSMIPENVIASGEGPTEEEASFLRSVQTIRLVQEEFPPIDDLTLDIRKSFLPSEATLRYNASCVGNGRDTIYIIGGISLTTGKPLASVSQYNVLTAQFVDAGWPLGNPLVGPGVLGNSDLLYIAGGYTYDRHSVAVQLDVSLFDPETLKFSSSVSRYTASNIGWFTPQLIVYNRTLAVMGSTLGVLFDRQQVWPDMVNSDPWSLDSVTINSPAPRSGSVILPVPGIDSVTVYLFGGQILPPYGSGLSSDIFSGTMSFDDGHVSVSVVGFHYIAVAKEVATREEWALQSDVYSPVSASIHVDNMDLKENHKTHDNNVQKGNNTRTPSKTEIMSQTETLTEEDTSQTPTKSLSSTIKPTSTVSLTPTESETWTPSQTWTITQTEIGPSPPTPTPTPPDVPNNDGDVSVHVNGYEPVWYNFTFSILLSENLAQACPEIALNKTSISRMSSCLLRLSTSPNCDAPLLDIGNLTAQNAQIYQKKYVDPDTNTTKWHSFRAVGPVTMWGSLETGILNITGPKKTYNQDHVNENDAWKWFLGKNNTNSTRPFYQQIFLYICFSSGAKRYAGCDKGRVTHHSSTLDNKTCVNTYYKPLNAARPFVISPVTNWVPDPTTAPPKPTPAASKLSPIIIVLIIIACVTTLVSALGFLLCVLRGPRNEYIDVEQKPLLDDEEDVRYGFGRGASLPVHQKQGLLDGKYRVLRRLGRGSFSVVYLVERVMDGQQFALKYVQCADDLDRIEAMRECEVAYSLQGHPNVIQLVDMFMSYRFDTHLQTGRGARGGAGWNSSENSLIVRVDSEVDAAVRQRAVATTGERYLSLVMAFHEKGDLGKWIRQQKSEPMIPEMTIVSIAYQVLSVMQFMHSHNPPIIHRDLKPENILLSSLAGDATLTLRVAVTDFGLSRVMDKTFCETGVGSLPYVAPECWQRRYSTKVDIWAVGCIIYAACAKRVESDNVKVMFSECGRPDFKKKLMEELTVVYGYSEALATFIVYLLEPDPDRRPSAEEAMRLIRKRRRTAFGAPQNDKMVSLYKRNDKDDDEDEEEEEEEAMDEGGREGKEDVDEIHEEGVMVYKRSSDLLQTFKNDGSGNGGGYDPTVVHTNSKQNGGSGKLHLHPSPQHQQQPQQPEALEETSSFLDRHGTDHGSLLVSLGADLYGTNTGNHTTPSRQTLHTNSLPLYSAPTSRRGNVGAAANHSFRESLSLPEEHAPSVSGETAESVTPTATRKGLPQTPEERKWQHRQRLQRYFDAVAEECEACEFYITRRSPSFVLGPPQRPPRTPQSTTPFAPSLQTHEGGSEAGPHGGALGEGKETIAAERKPEASRKRTCVDGESMAQLPQRETERGGGKRTIAITCDDGSTITKDPSSSSSSTPRV